MQPAINGFPTPSPELLRHLDVAQLIVGDNFLPLAYREHLAGLHSNEQLIEIDRDELHPIWWFLPPVLYDLFDEKLEFDWLKQHDITTQSIVVVSPPFLSVTEQLHQELAALGLSVEECPRLFTRRFVGLLYGGYPWFESYLRICEANALFGLDCIVLRVASTACDVPRTLEIFKKRRRNSFGQSLQMAFNDLPYPGVIRPFHAPARIETQRHMRAAEIG